MTDAKRDNNSITTLIGVSSADGITPVVIWVDPVTHRVLVNATGGSVPGGSNTQVQYNNNGVMGGITGATTDGTTLTLVAPVLGAATATSINGLTITSTTGVLTIAAAKTLTVNNTLTFSGTDSSSIAFGAGGTVAYVANKLSVFAATSSAELAGVISDETGSGLLVFNNSPTFITPVLGAATATSINGLTINTTTGTFALTNGKTLTVSNTLTFTGTDGSSVAFGTGGTVVYTNVTSLASLTTASSLVTIGTVTSGGLGTGATLGSVTVNIASSAVGDLHYLGASNVLTRLAAVALGQVLISQGATTAPVYSATPTVSQLYTTSNAVTAVANATTLTRANRVNTVTNNSAATLTITLSTTSALDGDMIMVRVLDFSAVAQTLAWVNTENSTVTAPVLTNGSTTSPLTIGFQYNSATSKWRCIASA